MQDNKPRCALYCRVGYDDEEAPREAIERQLHILKEYARQLGYTETAEYLDNGYSGLNADRPAFAKLNADIKAGLVNVVVAKDPSRLWRDLTGGAHWYSRMDKKGVTVLCPDTPGFQQNMQEMRSELADIPKRKKRKQARHTVRTPPPQHKSR